MQSLIEQVKRLAEAQKEGDRENDDGSLLAEVLGAYGNGSRIMRVVDTFFIEFDFPALLAHLERMQAVVDAARSVLTALGVDDVPYTGIKRALENLENTDGK